ncbi:MAG: PH domain-containing protein [Polyangiales bacterium]
MNDSETIARARRLVDASPDSDDVLVGRRPSLFDFLDAGLLKTALSVVVLVALVDLDGYRTTQLLDPFDLMLRLFAAAAIARLGLAIARAFRRARALRNARRTALVRVGEDLVLLDADGGTRLAIGDVARVHVDPETPSSPPAIALLLRRPAARPFVVLPAPLATVPEATARRIERWIGARPEPSASPTFDEPSRRPNETYDEALRGPRTGTATIPAGHAWLARGPYAAVLFVAVIGERILHLPPGVTLGAVPLAALVVCVAMPIVWWRIARRDAVSRGGLACVATPAELLYRNRFGIHRAPWASVTEVRVEKQTSWTVLEGVRAERKVVIDRDDDSPIVLDERTMGLSAHTVRAVLEAYRAGVLPGVATPASAEEPSPAPPSQGTGGGGGISGVEGTTA